MTTKSDDTKPQVLDVCKTDYEAWKRLFAEYIACSKLTVAENQYPNTFDRLLSPEENFYAMLIRDQNSHVVGFTHYYYAYTSWTDRKCVYINDLFISSEQRCKGYGRTLIEAVVSKAKSLNSLRVVWVTKTSNDAARCLYDKIAFCDKVEYQINIEDAL